MKVAALLFVVCLLAGCYFRTIVVPPTAEGQACVRQCMLVFNSCMAAPYEQGCHKQHDQCLLTCPGAYVEE